MGVPRQNHISLKGIDFALCRLSCWTPCSRCFVSSWFHPVALEKSPWRTWPSVNSSRSSSGSARGRGCEARIVCSGYGCPGPGRIGRVLVIVRPETVVSWHRKGFRLFWAWISRRRRTGRPQASREITALIRKMATANPFWGATRIHGELLQAGHPHLGTAKTPIF